MAVKRKRTGIFKKRSYIKRPAKKRRFAGKAGIQRVVQNMLTKKLETKTANYTSDRYVQILNNSFVALDSTLLSTSQGTGDSMTSNTFDRIGDEITLKGVSLKFFLEMNERFSDVTIRIMLVRSARGDIPQDNLFTGLSANKMMDTINSERFTVMMQKYVHMKAGNNGAGLGATDAAGTITSQVAASGIYLSTGTNTFVGNRATRIVKMWIPGTKFGRGGKIKYENGSTRQKFFDYTVLVYAYCNYNTHLPGGAVTTYNIAAVGDYVKQLHFTDA